MSRKRPHEEMSTIVDSSSDDPPPNLYCIDMEAAKQARQKQLESMAKGKAKGKATDDSDKAMDEATRDMGLGKAKDNTAHAKEDTHIWQV